MKLAEEKVDINLKTLNCNLPHLHYKYFCFYKNFTKQRKALKRVKEYIFLILQAISSVFFTPPMH